MLDQTILSDDLKMDHRTAALEKHDAGIEQNLPASITRAASQQTYYTVRFLVDRERVADAFRAYAYFRWVDDHVDQPQSEKAERIAFVERQQAILAHCLEGELPRDLTVEERMLVDLLRSGQGAGGGLQAYIRHMMAVMAFDAERRGRLISQRELDDYTHNLAAAVTEALHYFIGHDQPAPNDSARYQAATGAHIAHMLRDTFEDNEAGYFNIPKEYLEAHGIGPCDVESDAYRQWVKDRVEQARDCFAGGQEHLMKVENLRCRMAGYAYMARFLGILDAIEREGYRLRPEYPERKRLSAKLKVGGFVLNHMLRRSRPAPLPLHPSGVWMRPSVR